MNFNEPKIVGWHWIGCNYLKVSAQMYVSESIAITMCKRCKTKRKNTISEMLSSAFFSLHFLSLQHSNSERICSVYIENNKIEHKDIDF